MDFPFPFILEHALNAHWYIFALFMLAGLNLPISEDFLIIMSGVLASSVVPENIYKLFIAVFLGAYLSDFIPYWLGRRFGPNLWNLRWFSRMIKKERLEQVKVYYKKYGVLTLLIGRFIPFGVRNCLFVTAGMGKMPFWKFVFTDGVACLVSNATLFTLSYLFCKNYDLFNQRLSFVNLTIFLAFLFAVIIFFWYKRAKSKEQKSN